MNKVIPHSCFPLRFFLLGSFLLLSNLQQPALAWDSVGHRLSAAVALNFLDESKTLQLLDILSRHPRYEQDFLDEMPGFVRNNASLQTQWLLGQAAFWPDMARGLPGGLRDRYHRGTWHYTDGAWVRDSAPTQGNSYVGIDAFADIRGEPAAAISSERQVHNVVTALDYNARILADASQPGPKRAVALCWLLHLAADIHQPLHTGSLFSTYVFADGDRGGNGIPTDNGNNLHSRWDRALRDEGIAANLPLILNQVGEVSASRIEGVESDWTVWMNESRQLLRTMVYTEAMKAEIAAADPARREPGESSLSADYVAQMKISARQRIGLAGLRLAIWFENELP